MRDAVAERLDTLPDLRWPNDLLIRQLRQRQPKFCGILTEMHAEPDRIHFVVVGIGINVNHERMPEAIEDSPRRCASRPANLIRASNC